MKDEKIVCLVAAAGKGKRFGRETPKTFHPVEGLTLLVRSLKSLSAWDGISRFVVMVPEGWREAGRRGPGRKLLRHRGDSDGRWGVEA